MASNFMREGIKASAKTISKADKNWTKRKKGESINAYLARINRIRGHKKKVEAMREEMKYQPKKTIDNAKKKAKKSERQRRIEARKEAEELLGLERGGSKPSGKKEDKEDKKDKKKKKITKKK